MAYLEITTMIGCPLMCTFCPQKELKAAYAKNEGSKKDLKYLSYENFETVLNKLPKHVAVGFSGMAEPWANPSCTDMLRLTLEKGFNVRIFTTLYGLTVDDAKTVIGLLTKHKQQVKTLVIHLPDSKGNMVGWKPSHEWLGVFNKFVEFWNAQILSSFGMMTMNNSGIVHPALNVFNVKLTPGWAGNTRAGSLDETQVNGQKLIKARHEAPVSCSATPFYDRGVLLPNGDVALCCMDYGLKHIIGNLLDMEYYDLFQSEGMNKLRDANMTPGLQKCSICKSCEQAAPYKNQDSYWTFMPGPPAPSGLAT